MISAGRIVTIFRTKGQSGEFTKLASEFTPEQLSPVLDQLGNEPPLIVSFHSERKWFVVTKLCLVSKRDDRLDRIPLDQVARVRSDVRDLAMGKRHDGKLDFLLRNGSLASIDIEAGGPYVAMLNVFLYLAKVNRPRDGDSTIGTEKARQTTNDERPTM